jgi:hypothetical protein
MELSSSGGFYSLFTYPANDLHLNAFGENPPKLLM